MLTIVLYMSITIFPLIRRNQGWQWSNALPWVTQLRDRARIWIYIFLAPKSIFFPTPIVTLLIPDYTLLPVSIIQATSALSRQSLNVPLEKWSTRDFLGGPVVRTLHFHCQGVERLLLTQEDTGILGLRRRRIQSGARDEAWSLRAFV